MSHKRFEFLFEVMHTFTKHFLTHFILQLVIATFFFMLHSCLWLLQIIFADITSNIIFEAEVQRKKSEETIAKEKDKIEEIVEEEEEDKEEEGIQLKKFFIDFFFPHIFLCPIISNATS